MTEKAWKAQEDAQNEDTFIRTNNTNAAKTVREKHKDGNTENSRCTTFQASNKGNHKRQKGT